MGRGRQAVGVVLGTTLAIALLLVGLLVWLIRPGAEPAPWDDDPVVSEDGRTVTVRVVGGACDDPDVDVAETSRQVVVTVRNEGDWFVFQCDDIGIVKEVTVELDAPLGERELVDGSAEGGERNRPNPR